MCSLSSSKAYVLLLGHLLQCSVEPLCFLSFPEAFIYILQKSPLICSLIAWVLVVDGRSPSQSDLQNVINSLYLPILIINMNELIFSIN